MSHASESTTPTKVTKVEVVKLSPRTLKSYSTYVGHLTPIAKVTVSSEIPGIIEEADIAIGKKIKRGQILARIDTKRQILNNKLNKSNYELALKDYVREQHLFNKKLSTAAKVSTLKNRLDVSMLRLELSKLDLIKSKLKAPITGIIKDKFIEEGEYIGIGKKMFEIFDISSVLAVINIPEREIRFAETGKNVSVTLDALPESAYSGIIKTIGLEADKMSRSFEVEIKIKNPEKKLLPGMLVRVKMLRIYLENQLMIPRHIIQEEESGSFAYIVDNSIVIKRSVKLGVSVNEEVQILSGLEFGDYLIEIGHQLVASKEKVKIIKSRKQNNK